MSYGWRFVPAATLSALLGSILVPFAHAQTPTPDPQMEVVLDELKSIMGTPFYELSPADARQQFGAEDAAKIVARQTGKASAPEPVGSVVDKMIFTLPGPFPTRVYTTGGQVQDPRIPPPIPIRIYTPVGQGPFPVIVYFHGGGFVIATIDTYDASARALTNLAGAIVVSVEFRKAPEFPFPAAVDDAIVSYRWVVANAASFNGISSKVAVAGESAGGNLATVVCMAARDEGFPMPVYQALVYPLVNDNMNTPSYIEFANAIPLNKPALAWFSSFYYSNPADHTNPYAFPLKGRLAGLPPATIIGAEIDPLQSEGQQYATALQAAGVPVNYKLYTGVTHEFFGMGAVVDKARQAETAAATDLKTAFSR